MLYVVTLSVVIALIVAALWSSGLLLPGKSTASQRRVMVSPTASIIGVGLIAFAVGLLAGLSQPKETESSVGKGTSDKELGALASRLNQEGVLGTMVKPRIKPGSPDEGGQAGSGGDLAAMTQRLEKKMAGDSKNGEGWLLLARAYLELHQHGKAVDSFAKAAALLPPEANMLADWADAYVVTNDRKWDDKARGIVKQALAADNRNLKALSLAGSEAFARADYKLAIDFWGRMKAEAPADSAYARLADSNIHEATELLKTK